MEGENLPIIHVMDETSQKQVVKNKAAIKSIDMQMSMVMIRKISQDIQTLMGIQ